VDEMERAVYLLFLELVPSAMSTKNIRAYLLALVFLLLRLRRLTRFFLHFALIFEV